MSGMLRAGGYNLCVKILFIFLLSVIIACHHLFEFVDKQQFFISISFLFIFFLQERYNIRMSIILFHFYHFRIKQNRKRKVIKFILHFLSFLCSFYWDVPIVPISKTSNSTFDYSSLSDSGVKMDEKDSAAQNITECSDDEVNRIGKHLFFCIICQKH